MSYETNDNLDQLIAREKRLVAEEHFQDMWDAAIADGIDPEIVARTVLLGALNEISRTVSDNEALSLLAEMDQMAINGDFLPAKTIQ